MSDNPYEKSLGDILKSYLGQENIKDGYFRHRIRSVWEQSMGAVINKYTESIYIDKRVCFVSLSSSPLRQELNLGKAQILKLINEELGENYLTEIHFR